MDCHYLPDASSCLTGNAEQGKIWLRDKFKAEGSDLYQKRVGIVLNAHLYGENLLDRDFLNLWKIIFDFSKLVDNTNASFIFFPMSTRTPDDRITNGMVAGRCKFWQKNSLIYDRLSVQETLNLVSACDTIISSRLHSLIFATAVQCPFIEILHHDKCRNHINSLGLSDWTLPYWDFCYGQLFEMVKDRLNNKNKYVEMLEKIHTASLNILEAGVNNVHFV